MKNERCWEGFLYKDRGEWELLEDNLSVGKIGWLIIVWN